MERTDNDETTMDSQIGTGQIPPEEEELFREFQAYARSIYTAATDGAVQTLTSATARLKLEVDMLNSIVVQSRENYQQLFEPAVTEFKASAGRAVASMSQRQEELFKQLAQQHQAVAKQNADAMTSLIKGRAKLFVWLMAGIGLLLVSVLILLIFQATK